MDEYQVELSARAEQDIREIDAYIRKHGPADPAQWRDGLAKTLASLEHFPEGCALVPKTSIGHEQFCGKRSTVLFA